MSRPVRPPGDDRTAPQPGAPAVAVEAAAPAAGATPDPRDAPPPPVARRLACFLYEGVLLFGVVMIAGLLWSVATNQRHALAGQTGMQAFLFVVLGVYFVFFWSRHGQTLAMRTWHIRLVRADGSSPGVVRSMARYLLAWLWFVPALLTIHLAGLKGGWPITLTLICGVLAYAALARLHPGRQYWHDAACGTRLVHWKPPVRPPSATSPGTAST